MKAINSADGRDWSNTMYGCGLLYEQETKLGNMTFQTLQTGPYDAFHACNRGSGMQFFCCPQKCGRDRSVPRARHRRSRHVWSSLSPHSRPASAAGRRRLDVSRGVNGRPTSSNSQAKIRELTGTSQSDPLSATLHRCPVAASAAAVRLTVRSDRGAPFRAHNEAPVHTRRVCSA